MPVTRHMEQDGFKHIMENVLNITAETREALKQQGIDTIPDLLNEPFDILDKLEYHPMVTDNDGNQTPSRSKKPSLQLLQLETAASKELHPIQFELTQDARGTYATHNRILSLIGLPSHTISSTTSECRTTTCLQRTLQERLDSPRNPTLLSSMNTTN